jgi:hypothetical protein
MITVTTLIDGLAATFNQSTKREGQDRLVGILSLVGYVCLLIFGRLFLSWVYGDWEQITLFYAGVIAVVGVILALPYAFALLIEGYNRLQQRLSPQERSRRQQRFTTRAQRALLAALIDPTDELLPIIPIELAQDDFDLGPQRITWKAITFSAKNVITLPMFLILTSVWVLPTTINPYLSTILLSNVQTFSAYDAQQRLQENLYGVLGVAKWQGRW